MPSQKKIHGKKPRKKLILSDKAVERLYSNLHNQTALGSIAQFAKTFKEPLDLVELEKSLSKIPAYSRHRRVRKRYLRPSLIVREPRQYYCADLAQVDLYKNSNNNYRYLLIMQDCFSKLLAVVATKTKTGKEVSKAIETGFKKLGGASQHLIVDAGTEFLASESKQIYKKYGVNLIVSRTQAKSWQCEITIRYLKEKIHKYMSLRNTKRYIDILHLIVRQMNEKVHSSHGFPPISINKHNSGEAFSRMYRKLITNPRPPPKFKPGNIVRLSAKRVVFSKGYRAGFSEELFRIKSIIPSFPVYSYKLEDLDNVPVQSSFVSPELSYVRES